MNPALVESSPERNPQSSYKVHLVWGSVFILTCALIVIALKTANDAVIKDITTIHDVAVNDLAKLHDGVVSDLKNAHDVTKKDLAEIADQVEVWAKATAAEAEIIAAKFSAGTITDTFKSESPIFDFIKVGRLEVAVGEYAEEFKREDQRTSIWGLWDQGKTISLIKVPATYRYHLDMAEDWRIEVKDKACVVHAPSLKPSLPVAIHTDRMEKYSASSWTRFDDKEQMEELQRGITPDLNSRAAASAKMNDARREGRDVVARFVRKWLLASQQWQDDRFTSITVIFADETQNTDVTKPTLTVETLP